MYSMYSPWDVSPMSLAVPDVAAVAAAAAATADVFWNITVTAAVFGVSQSSSSQSSWFWSSIRKKRKKSRMGRT